jgi:hypothetical protein
MRKKDNWPVRQLVSKSQQHILRKWLRHDENLSSTEEMVCICDPKVGEKLSDEEERSSRDIIDY